MLSRFDTILERETDIRTDGQTDVRTDRTPTPTLISRVSVTVQTRDKKNWGVEVFEGLGCFGVWGFWGVWGVSGL